MTEPEKKAFYQALGNKIVYYRKNGKMSQKALADKLGLSRPSIVNIEKGRQNPSIHLLIELATIFNIRFEELIDDNFIKTIISPSSEKIKEKIKDTFKYKTDQKLILSFYNKVANEL